MKAKTMAEAMINEKYMQATLPTLALPSTTSSLTSQQQQHQHQHQHRHQHQYPHQSPPLSSSSPPSTTSRKRHQHQHQHHHPQQQTQNNTNTTDSNTNNDDTRDPTNTSHHQRKYKVNFELPPSKRARRNPNVNIQNVITAIQTCISPPDRLDAIYDACIKFDHNIESGHDTEIAMGADIALFKHLPLLIIKRQRITAQLQQLQTQKEKGLELGQDQEIGHEQASSTKTSTKTSNKTRTLQEENVSTMEEISNTFTALEMVLRCSADSISTCFARIGKEFFPLLIDFIQDLSTHLQSQSLHSHSHSPSTTNTNTVAVTSPPSLTLTDTAGTITVPSTVAGAATTTGTSTSTSTNQRTTDNNDNNDQFTNAVNQQQQQHYDFDRTSKSSTPTGSCDGSTASANRFESENNNKDTSNTSNKNNTPTGSCDGSTASANRFESENNNKDTSNTSNKNNTPSSNAETASRVILKTCTKIIGHFARVGSLTETLANTPKLLNTLCDTISITSHSKIPIEATLNSLWIIANLACSAENMILMSRHPHTITTKLFEIVSHPTDYEETNCEGDMDIDQYIRLLRTRAVAVRAILNLSWAQENKIPFADNVDLVEDLLRIASHRKSPWGGSGRGVSGILLQSRRHACGTLRNLAAAPRKYKRRLCRLKSGQFLDILADIAKYDHDSDVRDKIHATLFNLVSADTAKIFTEKKDVLNVIISAATAPPTESDEKGGGCSSTGGRSSGKDMKNNDNTNAKGSRQMAEKTLLSLEKALPEDDEGYDALRPTLSRFDSQIAMNRTISNLGSVALSVSIGNLGTLGTLPSISNFSLGSVSHSNLNPETV